MEPSRGHQPETVSDRRTQGDTRERPADESRLGRCGTPTDTPASEGTVATPTHQGKAPPSGVRTRMSHSFEDWLPALQRVAAWNGWSNEEKLLQLAGHMRGLLQEFERETFDVAVGSLRTRLDLGSRAIAAQDFRHTAQRDQEPVCRLEQTFRLAYGMFTETRDMLLHCQLQEGLRYDLMKAPAISGAQSTLSRSKE